MSAALDRLSAALGLGPDADAILIPLHALYRELDAELAAATAGLDLPCKAGCDACCHESVFLSAPELLAVAAELFEHSAADRAALIRAMTALADRFADELELLETLPAGDERDEVAARIRFRCPLLRADGGCSVYAGRELNARTFGQTYDAARDHPYGCELTHARLVVLGPPIARRLPDPRDARRRLAAAIPGTATVHVYPWWFKRYGALIDG